MELKNSLFSDERASFSEMLTRNAFNQIFGFMLFNHHSIAVRFTSLTLPLIDNTCDSNR